MFAEMTDHCGRQQTLPGDERVTRIGRFLRRSCLDELPQLLDVLRGRMSLVGPRPHPIGMELEGKLFTDVIPNCDLRLRMRPGITGFAQIRGNRGPVHTVAMGLDRVNLDNSYIENWSFGLDISILFATLTLLFKKGSY